MTDQQAAESGYAAARLALLREDGRTGAARRQALSHLSDRWLSGLLADALQGAPAQGVALVAVGGYGRGELSPRSDLDVLLLHDGGARAAAVPALAERVWYPVWDQGVALDHSVRDLGQARKVAAEDLKAQLGLLDARHIAGDQELTASLRSAVLADWRATAPKRLPELRELCRERAERQGELAFLLEPDLKEARGGLRDVTALDAVAASWVADAPRAGLAEAATRLRDVRDALHLVTGRATDRLSLQEQDAVAADLGLLDADILLRQVYESARVIAYAADVTWREVERVLRARGGRGTRRMFGFGGAAAAARGPVPRRPLAEGVVEMEGEAVLAAPARPDHDVVLPLRAAAAAAQAGLPLALSTVRRLAVESKPLPVPWPDEAREQLITLLGAGESAIPVWEALEAEGLVARLLPDWERVRCRPQRNAVHRWTVDRHLVETAVRAAAMTRRVARPDLLLVAAFLHDIGKGWPGDHSEAGEVITRDVATRIGFPKQDVETLALLVRHHLLLVETAMRRDPDDPATVAVVTDAVGTVGTLELLHALTEADALATGPAAWSNWRATLVGELVQRAAAALAGDAGPSDSAVDATAEEERLAVEAARTVGPVLSVRAEAEGGEGSGSEPMGVELTLALPDRPDVLPTVAGVLALHRLTVRTAAIRELDPIGAGPVLVLTWKVAAEFGDVPEAARLRADIRRALDGGLDVARRLAERDASAPRRRGVVAPPPRVTVARGSSASATVLEVRAHDAPGLLHRIGRALEGTGVRVHRARISTLGADAVDAFYLTDAAGQPLSDAAATELARSVERALLA
ncbi:[protein-PII] uridylyltransferase [Streptacidiphilus jiangxiensis]|uniref:Bifunctional uridylyltransferase/uridylyl-removing enzyme n=1 Tax=Streptacidiphilus jiangxiensis TaxID=235985 RepID=A0A1H7XUS4_STRJI|nr:[protein-PII] uridylyltransferase [Streptacidiphilus jiangxiensis]SEM37393.1 [protein-PII] uridylyltransferase [Streptacidiphilus jiangxiensis]